MKKRLLVSILIAIMVCISAVGLVSAWYQNITLETYMSSVESSWSTAAKSVYFSYLNSASSNGAVEVFIDGNLSGYVTNIFYSEGVLPGDYENFTLTYSFNRTYQMEIKRFTSWISAYAFGYLQTP